MRTLLLFTLAALILAAGTAALWSRTAASRVRCDDIPLLHYVESGTPNPPPSPTLWRL